MLDFVVSGSRGFIGARISAQLRASGFAVASDHDFAKSGETTRFFVNCANIAASPAENVRLLNEKIELARFRAEVFVQLQSFITLHGRGEISTHAFNCGKRPALLDRYAAGKLEQERVICNRLMPPFVPHVCLLYLPAVLGKGGAWSAVLAQARAFGFALPEELDPRARANWIDVDDIASFLSAYHAKPPSAPLARAILNRAEGERLTWPEFLSGAAGTSVSDAFKENLRDRLKWAVSRTKQRLIARAFRSNILVPGEHFLRKLSGSQVPEPSHRMPEIAEHRLRFHGLIRHIVATQEFIHSDF